MSNLPGNSEDSGSNLSAGSSSEIVDASIILPTPKEEKTAPEASPFRSDFVPARLSTSSPIEPAPIEPVMIEPEMIEPANKDSVAKEIGGDANADTGVDKITANEIVAAKLVAGSQTESANQRELQTIDAVEIAPELAAEQPAQTRSWVFRVFDAVGTFASRLFGIASAILMLAVAANIPIAQFLSFGYLLEVMGRLARKRPLRESFIGLQKASRFGSYIFGTWLCLMPVRLISRFWYDAYLIDATSQQTGLMRILLFVGLVATLVHITMAWICGGKLRYFFWPIVAPFSFAVWASRKFAGTSWFRKLLSVTVGWMSPQLVHDICNAQPITDWFVPAIVFRSFSNGNLYTSARDGFFEFISSLNLPYYFKFGLKGFIGTVLWLIVPTSLLVISTAAEGPLALVCGLLGVLIAVPIFAALPFIQAHFSVDGRFSRFIEVWAVWKNIGRAPIAHVFALFLTLVLALPLFLLKIEEIPTELLWSLSIVFLLFTWPAKWIIGWAYRRGAMKERPSRWWIRYPISLIAFPLTLIFAAIFFFSRYITWNGAISLIENHVFLLPAPFWLDLFVQTVS